MELMRIIVGTKNINLNCLNQNDNMVERTQEEKMSGGPSAIKPIIYAILNLKNTNQAQNHLDFMKMTQTEGKNRMIEQIDDSNLMKDNELMKIRKDSSTLLLRKTVDIVSEESNLGYKCIQLIYLLETGLVTQYKNLFVLDENIAMKFPKFGEVGDMNRRCNILLKKAVQYIEENILFKSEKLEKDYMENPDVSPLMKSYLQKVGTEWIRQSKTTDTIYKSFRRKAKMTQAQKLLLSEFINQLRQANRSAVSRAELLKIFQLDDEYYKDNEYKALKPIDDLMDMIITYGDDTTELENEVYIDGDIVNDE